MLVIWPTLRRGGLHLPWRAMLIAAGSAIAVVVGGWGMQHLWAIPGVALASGAGIIMGVVAWYSQRHNPAVQGMVARIKARMPH